MFFKNKLEMKFYFVILCAFLGIACKKQRLMPDSQVREAKWALYRNMADQERRSSEHCSSHLTVLETDCGSTYIDTLRIKLKTFLQLDLVPAYIGTAPERFEEFANCPVLYFDVKYQNKCVASLCGGFTNGIVFVDGKPMRDAYDSVYFEIIPYDEELIEYIKKNKDYVNPWLLKEAKRRGLL